MNNGIEKSRSGYDIIQSVVVCVLQLSVIAAWSDW